MVAGSEINLNNLHDHGADGKVWYIGTTSQVLEPITQPRKTNTPRGPDFSDLANNILGTVIMADVSHSVKNDKSSGTDVSGKNKVKTGKIRYIKKKALSVSELEKYKRPTHFRKGVREAVWEKQKKKEVGGLEIR